MDAKTLPSGQKQIFTGREHWTADFQPGCEDVSQRLPDRFRLLFCWNYTNIYYNDKINLVDYEQCSTKRNEGMQCNIYK